MKRILLALAALLLCTAGCSSTAAAQETAAVDDVVAAATDSGILPSEETNGDEAEPVVWAGEYADGERTVTLAADAKGELTYRFSEGASGRITEVSGSIAKTDTLKFSLSGDVLSVVGDVYTGNYERR